MRFQTLADWLQWQETLHFTDVDPGLARIGQVWQSLGGSSTLPFTVITVAGTNGKGSSVAMLESILRAGGYRTGTYTSPHILSYNERICIDGKPASDDNICQAFNQIDVARQDTSLTYFEFATLAAITLFKQFDVDVVILEVGMGGRLDAVNLFDCDIALITPISLDHTNWLGNDREKIGAEKAGIITANKPVVLSEQQVPDSVLAHARNSAAPAYVTAIDFFYQRHQQSWHWQNEHNIWSDLPLPALEGDYQLQNAAAVLQVISLLNQQQYSISHAAIKTGLKTVQLAGRFQRISGDVEQILDVTHNEQGARNLVKLLTEIPCQGQTFAVLAMLRDKDPQSLAAILMGSIDQWFIAGLEGSRGMSVTELNEHLSQAVKTRKINQSATVVSAYEKAYKQAKSGDRILIFGSFHTVEAVLRLEPELKNKE